MKVRNIKGAELRRGGAALLLLAAAYFALFMMKGAMTALPADESAGEFSVERAIGRLERILADERPHPVDTEANDAVRERLLTEIREIGFEPEIRDDFSCRRGKRGNFISCARVRNVLFRAGPDEGRAILVASHYDSVPAGPGAGDDGAGVAAALEIAAILKTRRPVFPVIFLFTDGEEPGLLGARSFVKKDPVARQVAAVINMEARGAAGPAILFETSDPNGRDIEAYLRRTKHPVGNSLATDIYRMLPNDTDLSELLRLDVDAANFAFTDRVALYHTPSDNLANLDRRSLAHLGRSALWTLDGFLRNFNEVKKDEEARVIFADIFSQFMIVAPQLGGLAMILAGLAASVAAFFHIGGARPIRTAAAPLVAMTGAGIIAFMLVQGAGLLRADATFWYGAPYWTRAVIYLSAITAGVASFMVAADADRRRLLAASWFWFSAIGAAAYALAPGSAILFGVPAGLFACAALASAGAARLLAPISAFAVIAALGFWLPGLHHAEIGLGLAGAWPFAIFAALLFMIAAPIAAPADAVRPLAVLAPAAALFAVFMLMMTAPPYSPAAPRPLNMLHVVDNATGESFLALPARGGPPPRGMQAAAKFEKREIAQLGREYYAAETNAHDGTPVGAEIVSVAETGEGRDVAMRLSANGADEIQLVLPPAANASRLFAGGQEFGKFGDDPVIIRCSGRSCATFDIRATLGPAPVDLTVLGLRHRLGEGTAAIEAARPGWATPIQTGDARIVLTRISL